MYLMRTPIPVREDIAVEIPRGSKKSSAEISINISKIYEHDLFDTYQKEEITVAAATIPPLPDAPDPIVASAPKPPEPQFVDPLDITLKGIIVISTEESKNRAIIEDPKTKTEKNYKVGDFIYDAQLIRIFSNKVVVLRSNGQQEVLYLREQDAKLDPVYSSVEGWDQLAQERENGSIIVARHEFISRVKNLAHFIDLLDLTTAYKDGLSIGCRIGLVDSHSLAYHLGLRASDIVIAINGIPTAQTSDRVRIYKTITTLADEIPIIVSLIRNGKEYTLTYLIESQKQEKHDLISTEKSEQEQEQHDKELMVKKHSFAPTIEQLQKREKELMREKGKAPSAPMPPQKPIPQTSE